MALAAENRHEAPQECPVCFENVLLAKRTLSCRHVFCQDCLSKIMVVARSRGSIICPLCRQATYLNKENPAGETLAADVDTTQEVALPLPMGYLVMASRASIVGLLCGGNWMMHHLRRLSRRSSEQTVTYRNGSQVFIISDQVRPTTCSDTAVGIPEAEPPECMECRVTKSDCIGKYSRTNTVGQITTTRQGSGDLFDRTGVASGEPPMRMCRLQHPFSGVTRCLTL